MWNFLKHIYWWVPCVTLGIELCCWGGCRTLRRPEVILIEFFQEIFQVEVIQQFVTKFTENLNSHIQENLQKVMSIQFLLKKCFFKLWILATNLTFLKCKWKEAADITMKRPFNRKYTNPSSRSTLQPVWMFGIEVVDPILVNRTIKFLHSSLCFHYFTRVKFIKKGRCLTPLLLKNCVNQKITSPGSERKLRVTPGNWAALFLNTVITVLNKASQCWRTCEIYWLLWKFNNQEGLVDIFFKFSLLH